MAVKKSIAIIGEGETEWFYFDSLRIACRYPLRWRPIFPNIPTSLIWQNWQSRM